jgi:hypothetical protein
MNFAFCRFHKCSQEGVSHELYLFIYLFIYSRRKCLPFFILEGKFSDRRKKLLTDVKGILLFKYNAPCRVGIFCRHHLVFEVL